MGTFILSIHIIGCILLILIVLLQTGKGADMGASFGGASSQGLFGGAGPASFLSKITTGIAVIFMLTSLSLAYLAGNKSNLSVMPDTKPQIEQKAKSQIDQKTKPPIKQKTDNSTK